MFAMHLEAYTGWAKIKRSLQSSLQTLQFSTTLDARPPGIPVLEVKNSPPLSVKIPENSRYENTAYTSRV